MDEDMPSIEAELQNQEVGDENCFEKSVMMIDPVAEVQEVPCQEVESLEAHNHVLSDMTDNGGYGNGDETVTVDLARANAAENDGAPAEDDVVGSLKRDEVPGAPNMEEMKPVPEEEVSTTIVDEVKLTPEEAVTPVEPKEVYLWGVPLLPSKGDKCTDVVLLKFLHARDFKATTGFTMLKNTILWCRNFGADSIVEEDFSNEFDGFVEDGMDEAFLRGGTINLVAGMNTALAYIEGVNKSQLAADVISRIAVVMKQCLGEQLMGRLSVVLYEYLGQEYPKVLESILMGKFLLETLVRGDVVNSDLAWKIIICCVREQSLAKLKSLMGLVLV